MRADDYAKLLADLEQELLAGAQSVGILGLTRVALRLLDSLTASGLLGTVGAIYILDKAIVPPALAIPVRDCSELALTHHDVLVVAADAEKEDILIAALPFVQGAPKVIVAGYAHLEFRDPVYRKELGRLYVPSFANGYPHSLTHIYQCLVNAARLGLRGAVAEFGMFKGGTTMFMSRIIEHLNTGWPILGFDSFAGFPPRRSPLDMYDHPDCVFDDLPAVRRYFAGRDVEIIPGDIVDTCERLAGEDLVLTFVDTDNYTPAKAALAVVKERTVIGGAIVFDHFTGSDRFRYTLGERIAGATLLDDARYFHLHGTGVFYRQR